MSEKTAFYIRTGPTFVPPRHLMASLRVVVELGSEGVERIAAALSQASGFLSDLALEGLIASIVGTDAEKVGKLTDVLSRGVTLLRDGAPPTALLDHLNDSAITPPGGKASLTADEKTALADLLPKLIRRYAALERHAKAVRLAEAFTLRAEAVNLVCDLRPVFDDTRTHVEGVIPVTTLKVVASGVDRFPVSFEAVLSAKDVLALQKEVERAMAKLKALGRFTEDSRLPIPAVEITDTNE